MLSPSRHPPGPRLIPPWPKAGGFSTSVLLPAGTYPGALKARCPPSSSQSCGGLLPLWTLFINSAKTV